MMTVLGPVPFDGMRPDRTACSLGAIGPGRRTGRAGPVRAADREVCRHRFGLCPDSPSAWGPLRASSDAAFVDACALRVDRNAALVDAWRASVDAWAALVDARRAFVDASALRVDQNAALVDAWRAFVDA